MSEDANKKENEQVCWILYGALDRSVFFGASPFSHRWFSIRWEFGGKPNDYGCAFFLDMSSKYKELTR
jgi:hypothetical protein